MSYDWMMWVLHTNVSSTTSASSSGHVDSPATTRRKMPVELRPHQIQPVEDLANGKILCGGVGSGKTYVALFYFITKVCGGVIGDRGSMKTPMNIIVITTARKRDSLDWTKAAAQLGIGTDPELHPNGVTITVDSWNNIGKYRETKDAFFVFDEQRVVGSGAWTKHFFSITKHNQWILLSATPGDTWMDYIPVFVANGFVKNRTQFKRDHVIYSAYTKFPKVERYVGVRQLIKWKNQVLVQMPYARHTVRHDKSVRVEFDEELFLQATKKRWHVYEDRPIKDVSELFSLMRKIVNSDHSRLEAVQWLMTKHPKLIVFYNFDYELEALRTLKDEGVNVAEWNGHKHEEIPQTDSWVYLVQYVAGAEAWNCIETDAICFYSLTYSYKNFEQAHGRIDRMNTPFTDLWYYILRSNSMMDKAIWRSLSDKENFNESRYVKQSGLGI